MTETYIYILIAIMYVGIIFEELFWTIYDILFNSISGCLLI